jgi:RNA polymerase sigma-70 factor (ECF subfamily)
MAGEKDSPLVYCIVPRELAPRVHDALREHFRGDPGVTPIVEFRRTSRRRLPDRRQVDRAPAQERRRIRNADGRRVAERRTPTALVESHPSLPPVASEFADSLVFVEREELSDQDALDADTKRLVTGFQAGDPAAFDEIYLRHFDTVYGYAHAAVRNSHDAEDAAQHVFVRALQALPEYEVRLVPFRAWLFRIARNVVMDSLRRGNRILVEAPEELAERQEAVALQGDPDLSWLSEREVAAQVEMLPRAQREVIVLRYLLDLPYDEIAGLMGETRRTTEHLHRRAIRVLEGRLA